MSASQPRRPEPPSDSATNNSDSENYDANDEESPSPPSSSSSPLILYSPPTIWGLLRGAAINLILPFVNGLMLGFGELLAHEAAFRLGWSGTKSAARVQRAGFHARASWRPSSPLRAQPWTRPTSISSSPLSQIRYQSTAPAADSSPIHTEPLLDDRLSSSSTNTDLSSDFSTEGFPTAVTEPLQLGFLKDYGLDFGWGPSSFMGWIFEHIHVYSGLPFFATITLTAGAFRFLMMPLVMSQASNAARLQAMNPVLKPKMDAMKAASASGDQAATQMARAELSKVYKAANIKMYKMALPLVQIPLGFGMFRVLRNLGGNTNVPGLDTGGIWWFTDLTVADPYWIMPVACAVMTHFSVRISRMMQSNTSNNPEWLQFTMMWGLPACMPFFISWLPAAVQLSFVTTSLFSVLTNGMLLSNTLRGFFRMPKRFMDGSVPSLEQFMSPGGQYAGTMTKRSTPSVEPLTASAAPAATGTLSRLREGPSKIWSAAKEKLNTAQVRDAQEARSQKKVVRKAEEYEAKRRRELDVAREGYQDAMKRRRQVGSSDLGRSTKRR
ncbi:MAG: Mitochondrial inner membrane protein oxa1 [Chrysothrix sp. TS-e1954]|nr:MAG: Mitochondrial inner membrane protein oxa1 [Chrysothrix sp. TS-e1954]